MKVVMTARTDAGEYGPIVLTPLVGGKHEVRVLPGAAHQNYAEATRFEVSNVESLRRRANEVFDALPGCIRLRAGEMVSDGQVFSERYTIRRIVELGNPMKLGELTDPKLIRTMFERERAGVR